MNGWPTTEHLAGRLAMNLARARASGDSAAFEEIFLQYHAQVVRILARIVGDRARAEQLASDVFWKLYAQPPRHKENLGGWLYRTAVRTGLDAVKMSARRARHESMAAGEAVREAAAADPLSELLRVERCRQVRATLARLKRRHAQLLILRSSGLSYQQLAETLNLNPRSIGTLLARAEKAFERHYRRLHSSGE